MSIATPALLQSQQLQAGWPQALTAQAPTRGWPRHRPRLRLDQLNQEAAQLRKQAGRQQRLLLRSSGRGGCALALSNASEGPQSLRQSLPQGSAHRGASHRHPRAPGCSASRRPRAAAPGPLPRRTGRKASSVGARKRARAACRGCCRRRAGGRRKSAQRGTEGRQGGLGGGVRGQRGE